MTHYPLQVREFSLPELDWPEAVSWGSPPHPLPPSGGPGARTPAGPMPDPGTPQLYWIPRGSSGPLGELDLQPQGEPSEGRPEEGTVLENPGGEPWVPVWLMEPEEGSWWAVDATSGRACGGSLPASPGPALGRLAFCGSAALMLSFTGSAVVYWLLVMVGSIVPMAVGEGPGKACSLAFGLIAIAALTLRLNSVLPSLLAEPVERAQSEKLNLPVSDRWLGLLQAGSTLMGLITLLGLLGCLAGSMSRTGSLGALLMGIIQTVLSGYLAVKCRSLSRGRPFIVPRVQVPPGPLGDLVSAVVHITLFAIAGQLAGGLLAAAGYFPRWDMAGLTLQGAQWGAILGAATTRLSRQERAVLLAGLIAKSLGEYLMGGWLAIILALVAVATPGALAALQVSGPTRRLAFMRAIHESWAFSFGLVLGRIVGRVLGLFFLGLGGMAVGEALAEQLTATAALMSERRRAEQS